MNIDIPVANAAQSSGRKKGIPITVRIGREYNAESAISRRFLPRINPKAMNTQDSGLLSGYSARINGTGTMLKRIESQKTTERTASTDIFAATRSSFSLPPSERRKYI